MFTENQVRQFYVCSNPVAPSGSNPTNASNTGAMKLVVNGDEAYFLYKGPSEDGLQRTDLIKKAGVMDVRLTDADDLKHIKKKVEVTLVSTPIVGEDYVLHVQILNYVANGDDSTLEKYGVAKATNTTASDLYKNLAISLAKNFAREEVKMIKVTLKGDASHTEITSATKFSALNAITATGIEIEEVEQPWRRGAAPQEFVNFEVSTSTVYVSTTNQDVVWGTVTDITASNTSSYIVNSRKVADMEWFFMKERAEKYYNESFPYNVDTVYQVDPANASGYSFVDIHFYFEGNCHNVGHSEKTLTIVGTKSNLNTLVGAAASGGSAATGLYAFLDGTNVTIKKSASW